jgi:hypothetical protein
MLRVGIYQKTTSLMGGSMRMAYWRRSTRVVEEDIISFNVKEGVLMCEKTYILDLVIK